MKEVMIWLVLKPAGNAAIAVVTNFVEAGRLLESPPGAVGTTKLGPGINSIATRETPPR
jgi:hypothetical protein